MSSMDLFLRTDSEKLEFTPTKVASPLPDNPDEWGQAVLEMLAKEAPYAMEYSPQVHVIQSNPGVGTVLGAVILTSASQSALSAAPSPAMPAPKRALIPFLIKNEELAPIDLLMTQSGRIWPLTQVRLREALFRPETFDMVTRDQGDNNIQDIFGIDNSAGFGSRGMLGGPQVISSGVSKFSSADYRILHKLAAQKILSSDLGDLAEKVASTPGLTKAASRNRAFLGGLQALAQAEKSSTKTAARALSGLRGQVPVHVAQFGSDGRGGYWMKTANREAFVAPVPVALSRRDLLKIAGEAVAVKVDQDGTTTVADQAKDEAPLAVDKSEWDVVTKTGIYTVRTEDGRDLTGWVFANLTDFDGTRLPLAVFTNGSESAVQSEIAGSPVSQGVGLPAKTPAGTGLFYVVTGNNIDATIPVEVIGSERTDTGLTYHVKTLTGETRRIRLVPGVKALTEAAGDVYLPAAAQFMPVDNEKAVALVERPEGLEKTAAHSKLASFTIYGDGSYFSYRVAGLSKLASTLPSQLTYDDAVFALCSAGCSAGEAHRVLKQASYGRATTVYGLRDVTPAPHRFGAAAAKLASRSSALRDLRVDLTKEAAVLPDAMTVDAALGLQFINSDNIRVFVAEIPHFERCINRLCELLLASRLGIGEVPEYAAGRAARSLDDVVQGLKALSLRKVEESAAF